MHASKKICVVCCALVLPEAATGADQPELAAMKSIRADGIRSHVEFLADDLLEGRGTGTRGYDLAAKYVAAQFEAMGLTPAGVNGTYFQPIRFRNVVIQPAETSIVVTRDGREKALVYGEDYFGIGDRQRPLASVRGEVVYVGHGVTAPEFGIDDYKGIDVRGKIVAFLPGAQAQLPITERAHFSNEEDKLAAAADHGAIAALRLRDTETETVQAYSRILRNSTMPTMAWIGNGSLNGRTGGISTLGVMSLPGTRKLFSGPTPDKPAPLSISVSIQVTSRHSEVTSPNVVAMLPGSDPQLRNEYVIYSAHLDHLGIGEPVNGDAIYNGARDNASGAAALIEIARAFTRLATHPRRSIIFLAPTAEEKGLLGSDAFAANPTVPFSQIVADINIDGLSILYDARDVVVVGADHSSLGNSAREAAAIAGLEATPDTQPEQNWFRRADHYSFVRRGIPALFLRTGTKPVDPTVDALSLANTWYATRYHMPSDDLNQPLNWESGARETRFSFALGYVVAQSGMRPQWNRGDFFGRTFGRSP